MIQIQFGSTICRDLSNAERMAFVWWLYWLGGGLDGVANYLGWRYVCARRGYVAAMSGGVGIVQHGEKLE